jgi:hypothetical protein
VSISTPSRRCQRTRPEAADSGRIDRGADGSWNVVKNETEQVRDAERG